MRGRWLAPRVGICREHKGAYLMTWFDETSEHFEEFKSEILRIANIVAKVDGQASSETITQLKLIRWQNLARQNHYQLTDEFNARLATEIQSKIDRKDEHFGNGRMVRNLFEHAIRELANRVVLATELTPDLLSTFQPEDLPESCAATRP
jgi:hypothetical protein